MENASDALKMAGAVLIFVGALSLAVFALTRARQTSARIMDKSNQGAYYDLDEYISVREVGIETVITNLYSYYNDYTTILFYKATDGSYDEVTGGFYGTDPIKPMPMYYTEALDVNTAGKSQLERSTLRVATSGTESRAIYGFDINDEITRQEPWSYDERSDKLFIDALVKGVDSPDYDWSRTLINSGKNKYNNRTKILNMQFHYQSQMNDNALAYNTKGRFIERIGQYNYDAIYTKTEEGSTGDDGKRYTNTTTSGSVMTFDNGEQVLDDKITQKKIIQYIYIGLKD